MIKQLIIRNIELSIIAPIYKNVFLKNIPKEFIKGNYLKDKPLFCGHLINYFNKYYSNFLIHKSSSNIIHDTYYNIEPIKRKIKRVITVYDLIHETTNSKKNYLPKKKSVESADHIICISQSTKKKLEQIYNIDPSTITAIHLGYDHLPIINGSKKKTEKPFILFVGAREKYKNFIYFLSQFSKSEKLMKDFNIICFGEKKFTKKELLKINELRFKQNQILCINGNDETLVKLYQTTELFVFPSSHEGFGLPLIEAQANSCPVLCTDIDIFREICGDSASYFSYDLNNDNLKTSIEKILYSPEYRNQIIVSGKQNFTKYTWSKCATKTLKIYENI